MSSTFLRLLVIFYLSVSCCRVNISPIKEVDMIFLEKLDYMMDKYGLSKSVLSQKTGIPYTTIDSWYKKGFEGLKLTTLKKLNNFFNTSLDYWIIDEIEDENYGRSDVASSVEKNLLTNFRLLDEIDQTKILERIETLLESDKYKNQSSS